MLHVIGLGNPGEQYRETPHSIGRELIQMLRENTNFGFSLWKKNSQRNHETSLGEFVAGSEKTELILSTTFMNESGLALKHLDEGEHKNVVVVYDDIDLPFGKMRISYDRGDGGHNGIKSIEQHLKTRSFIRVRVGVCPLDWFGKARKPKGEDAVQNYLVKKKLSWRYTGKYEEMAKELKEILIHTNERGYTDAMNKFN